MSDDRRSPLGSCYYRRERKAWFVKLPTGRRTPSGRPSYDVRHVASQAEGYRLLSEARKAKRKGLLHANAPTRRQGGETVAEAITSYIAACEAVGRSPGTIEQYRITLKVVTASGLGAKVAQAVTPDDVRAFLAWRRENVWRGGGNRPAVKVEGAKASNAVLFRDRGLLASVYAWLLKEGRATANPCDRVPPPRKPQTNRRPFEPEEVEAFLAACGPELRPLAIAGFYSGQGAAELIALRWRDISFARRTLSVVRKKNGKAIAVPMHPKIEAELRRLKEERAREGGIPDADAPVFLSRRGERYASFPLAAWHTALKRAGLEGRGLTPHGMRRTFATFYEGQDRDLQALLGHSSLATTLIYRRSRDDRTRAAVQALDYSPNRAAATVTGYTANP